MSVQERRGISGPRAKAACLCAPVRVALTPRRGALSSGEKEIRGKAVAYFFPPLSPAFPLFLHPFNRFYFSHPRGMGRGGRGRILVAVVPAAPGDTAPPSSGCEAAHPGVGGGRVTATGPRHGRFAQ